MVQRYERRHRVRAIALRRERTVPWWAWALVAGGVAAAMPSWAQTATVPASPVPASPGVVPQAVVPEVVRPRGDTRIDNPGVDGGRPVPDRGVIVPPPVGSTPSVIRPPASGVMPVIPPPGSAGGERGVVPK